MESSQEQGQEQEMSAKALQIKALGWLVAVVLCSEAVESILSLSYVNKEPASAEDQMEEYNSWLSESDNVSYDNPMHPFKN